MPLTFDDLFNWVNEVIDEAGLSGSVSAETTNGRLHIRFDSEIMFAGNSYELLPAGRRALNAISPGINAINKYIATVAVEGHTMPLLRSATGSPDDWFISSMRALSVTNYLDFGRRMVDSDKFSSTGYGRYKPHYPTDTPTSNAKNRRVELVISRNDIQPDDTPVILDLLKYDYGLEPVPGPPHGDRNPDPAELAKKLQVEERIKDQYGSSASVVGSAPSAPEWGLAIPTIPTIPKPPASQNAPNGANGNGD